MDKGSDKIRLDQHLVRAGLVNSREKARAVIMAGLVQVDGVRLDKPGYVVPASASVILKKNTRPMRAGEGSSWRRL